MSTSYQTSTIGGIKKVAVPSEVATRKDLTIYDKLCYGALGYIAKEDFECSPIPREITKVLGIGKQKVHKIRRALLHLTSLGLVQETGKIMLPGETAYRISYHIIPPQESALTFLSGTAVLPRPPKQKPDPATLSKTRICIQCGIERSSTNFARRVYRVRKSGTHRLTNARRPRCRKCRTYNHNMQRMQLQPERDGAPAKQHPTQVLESESMTRGQATATRPNPEARIRGGDLRPTPLVESHVMASTGFWSGPQNIVHPENPKKPSARTNRPKPGSERSVGSTVPDALTATL